MEEAEGEIILLGDFNAHHPAWGGRQVASEMGAENFLLDTKRRGLSLLTPPGEATWKRGSRESVIDLTLATKGISERVEFCGPEDGWTILNDHLPIRIQLDLTLHPPAPSKRYAIRKLKREEFKAALKGPQWEESEASLVAIQQGIAAAL